MKYILILSLIFISISCKKEEVNEPKISNDYIPLQIGNEWQYIKDYYRNNISYINIIIDSDTIIEDIKYFKFIVDDTELDMLPLEILIRKSDDGKYYQYKDGSEFYYRIFEDGIYLNATQEGYKLNCNSQLTNYQTQIGKFENLKTVAVGEVEVDGGYTDVYSLGYGLIERSWFGGRWELNYLKVGDKVMGQKR